MSDKRKLLEELATELVQRAGFQNLSFRALARDMGIKSSSVHYYFPEKADLATALIKTYSAQFAEQLVAIEQSAMNPGQRLKAFVQIFENVISADKSCLCGMMAAELAILDEANRALLADYFKHAEDWLSTLFAESEKNIQSNLEPNELARVVMSGLEGAILIDRVEGGMKHLKAQQALIASLIS
jgi:TetR/AcrR family transcriptional repressor of nem operon